MSKSSGFAESPVVYAKPSSVCFAEKLSWGVSFIGFLGASGLGSWAYLQSDWKLVAAAGGVAFLSLLAGFFLFLLSQLLDMQARMLNYSERLFLLTKLELSNIQDPLEHLRQSQEGLLAELAEIKAGPLQQLYWLGANRTAAMEEELEQHPVTHA